MEMKGFRYYLLKLPAFASAAFHIHFGALLILFFFVSSFFIGLQMNLPSEFIFGSIMVRAVTDKNVHLHTIQETIKKRNTRQNCD